MPAISCAQNKQLPARLCHIDDSGIYQLGHQGILIDRERTATSIQTNVCGVLPGSRILSETSARSVDHAENLAY